jgi:ribosomal protein S18 acetylase RimI-like enzyme
MAEFDLRRATADDVPDLARLALMAGHGLFEALYEDVIPGVPASKIIERRFRRTGTTKSYEHCWVAVDQKRVVGGLNAYPTDDEAADPADPLLPKDRRYLIEPFKELEAPGTFYLNIVAVFPEYRSQGIGNRLLSFARTRAREIGLSELSLTTFEKNTRATALYERFGFREVKRSPGAKHESIRYSGNFVLMACRI